MPVTKGTGQRVVQEPASANSKSQVMVVEDIEDSGTTETGTNDSSSSGDGPQSTPYPTPLSPEDLPDGVSPALAQDAQWYADQYGVSLEEAINAADTAGRNRSPWCRDLRPREADTLAGLWIQHEPEYRVVVAFTKDGEATISKYVQDGRLAEIIEVRTAQATLQDLQKAQKDASKLVQRLGFNIASSINVFENRVEVYATDRAELEEALRGERQDASGTRSDNWTVIHHQYFRL